MWFCQKCNKWYKDEVSIAKHLKTAHSTSKSFHEEKANMVSDRIMAPGSVFTNKQMSILKSAKSLGMIKKAQFVKVKANDLKAVNGISRSKSLIKTNSSNVNFQKPQNIPDGFMKKVETMSSIPQNVKMMQITQSRDLTPISKLLSKKINKDDLLGQVKTYICKFCCRKFPNGGLLDIHQKSHGEHPKHACHVCSHEASTFSSLMSHFVKHSSGKTVELSNGSQKAKIYFEDGSIKKVIQKSGSSISCTRCKRIFNSKEAFNSHYCPALNKKTEFVCTYCRKVTTTVEEYRDHIQSHSAPLVCSSCGSQFSKRVLFDRHVAVCVKKIPKSKKSTSPNSSTNNNKKAKLIKSPTVCQKIPKKLNRKNISKTTTQPSNAAATREAINEKKVSQHGTDFMQNEHQVSVLNDDKTGILIREPSVSDIDLVTEPLRKKRRRRRTVTKLLIPEPELKCQRPARTLRSPSRYSAGLSSTFQPTRRSARLVNRKRISFSDVGEVSDPETSPDTAVEESVQENAEEIAEVHETKPEIVDTVTPPVENIIINKIARRKRIRKVDNKAATLYCQVCSLLFRSSGSLRRHKKMHTGKPQFVCQFCGKFFFRKDIHLRHENSVHHNTADKGYQCYYCKENFESSILLTEHSTETHVTKALIPERIRRCTGQIKSSKRDRSVTSSNFNISIKTEESENAIVSSPSKLKNKTSSTLFGKPQVPVPHFKNIPEPAEMSDTDVVSDIKPSVSQLNKALEGKINLSNFHESKIKTETIVAAENVSHRTSNEILMNANSVSSSDCNNSSLHKNDLAEFSSCNICQLCSKELPDDSDFECCSKVTHKAVDWFQCLVCSYSGTKSQVQEHMLLHTFRVGTLIVSEDDQDYNRVRMYLPLCNESLDNSDCHNMLSQTSFEDDCFQKNDTSDNNSMSTLMEEVKCVKCGDVIMDIDILLQHSCLAMDNDSYSCFVEGCNFITNGKSDICDHLKSKHYTGLFSHILSMQTCKTERTDRNFNRPFQFCSQKIENIFIESSLETIS